ncbi:right-handed parallel beta-helix repeat-containing protein [Methanobrevibacter filiformis]|uniref:right-handed parallel beta-helix repeat-containing protein n=1 Tax=Methanobrevibacter filiformis TaxID=55758 RepID=UPI0014721B07|nr:NosD domain-containing protein [Methanobrevibacter filiformis]
MNRIKKYGIILIFSILAILSVNTMLIIDDSVSYGADITVKPNLTNNQIQSLIDKAENNSNIIFTGDNYENIHIVINKALNISTKSKTTLKGSSANSPKATVLTFTGKSNGSTISGFNIESKNYGIRIIDAKNIAILNNHITKSSENAIYIEFSRNIKITDNRITDNQGHGITIISSNGTDIIENNITKNDKSGIILEKTIDTNINYNTIKLNKHSGIELNYQTEKTYIYRNNITNSSRGILVNSLSTNDKILSNYIGDNNGNIGHDDNGDTGCGIAFGGKYDRLGSNGPKIEYNGIVNHRSHSIMAPAGIGNNRMNFSTNWYGSNDPKKSHLCVHIDSESAQVKLVNTSNGVKLIFFDSSGPITDMASFDVKFYLNGELKEVTVENGEALLQVGQEGINFIKYIVNEETGNARVNNPKNNSENNNNPNNENSNGNNGNSSTNGNNENGESASGESTNGNGLGNSNNNETGNGNGNRTLSDNNVMSPNKEYLDEDKKGQGPGDAKSENTDPDEGEKLSAVIAGASFGKTPKDPKKPASSKELIINDQYDISNIDNTIIIGLITIFFVGCIIIGYIIKVRKIAI